MIGVAVTNQRRPQVTALLWDITSRLQNDKFETANLSPQELENLWTDLHSQDGARGYRAVWALAGN